ncbi:MAG: multiheme c-type cytochrome [Bryobacterales bacterium]|nr:multiheme c-type cytochrome [Bryobacterales bacterium]
MPATRKPGWLLQWLAAAPLPLLAQPLDVFDHPPEAYLGADACGACHAEQFAAQSASGHALSLAPVSQHPLASSFVPVASLVRTGGAEYSYRSDRDGLHVEVEVHGERRELQLEWAFGAGDQAVTFVGHPDEERYVEHHFSYYSATDSLATTPGHRDTPPHGVEDALGVYYQTFGPEPAIMRCFQCHSTGPLALGDGFSLQPRELGIRCEACHGPGSRHVEAITSGNLERGRAAVGNPGRLEGSGLLEFCGACHRPPESSGTVIDWSDPWNVRHQPVYLSRSACIEPGGQALTCIRCHAPPQPLSREAARDDGRCLDCHTVRSPPAATCRETPEQACSSCHMPAVAPQDNLRFTNHWIGIYNGDRPLRPRESGQ